MKHVDVTVIGAGPGGYVAAIRAAQQGATVALVEKEFVGGTCLNWGCIPTKCLIHGAELLDHIRHAADFGIRVDGTVTPDWDAMLARKDATVANLRKGIAGLLKANGVTVFSGKATFVDRRHVLVHTNKGDQTLETKTVIIATGSTTVEPGFLPKSPRVLYSKSALANPILPKTILVLGGGVIGSEFACLYARLGVTVTLVEMLPDILPMVDADVARVVKLAMKNLGIKILTGTPMTDIKASAKGVKATVGDLQLSADQLLVCVGRKAYTDGLNLAAAGLSLNERGLLDVDSACRTRAPGIYAIGDITGTIQYAHRASAMGIVAANNATGHRDTHSDHLVPACIFTTPEIGSVGRTEAQLKEQGTAYHMGKFPFAALGKAQLAGQAEGFCKILADKETDQVLGVHMVGPHATDLIAEAATAMNLEVTAEEFGRAIHAHPTLAEASMEAAHAVHDSCIHMPPRRRAKK